MADPAKLEFNSWIETLRRHIEQADQASQAGRSNGHRGKQKPQNVHQNGNSAAYEALQSLKSLHDDLVAQAATSNSSIPIAGASQQFSGQIANNVASQVAGQVISALSEQFSKDLAGQISCQISGEIASLFEGKLSRLQVASTDGCNEASDADTQDCSVDSHELAERVEVLELELSDLQASSLASEEQLRRAVDESESQLMTLQDELAAAYETVAELQAKLADAKTLAWSLDRNHEPDPDEGAIIAELEAEVASLQTALAAIRTDCWQVTDSSTSADIEKLKAELEDLRQQNAELASELARTQMSSYHNPPHLSLGSLSQESMTWEQRKKLILQQLENESADANPSEPSQRRLDVEDVLRTTQAEIDRRDSEIAELKSIVEQQSNTHEGVAIGAAAIAQMLDSDELVKLEREKLASIQREWESKLRDAEIQISMERAKLSRERAEIETQRKSFNVSVSTPQQINSIAETQPDGKPVRRWLEHLGLRDK